MPAAKRLKINHRKATGVYYTPSALIDLLLNHALPPVVRGAADLNELRILDPACGPGDFLMAIARRLKAGRLFGVELDGKVARCAREALGGATECIGMPTTIRAANALLAPPRFLKPGWFDLVIGNPPYVNPIEGDLSDEVKSRLRKRFPRVRGAADLSVYFLEQAIQLVRAGGRIAMVLPRSLLSAPSAQALRRDLPQHLRPNLIYAPDRCNFFEGASVFVCLLILGPESQCMVSMDRDPSTAHFEPVPVLSDNWWRVVHGIGAANAPHDGPGGEPKAIGNVFDIQGSMTTGDAYDLIPHLVDDGSAPGQRLVTTGLIQPGHCQWGQTKCRYLRRDLLHPLIRWNPDGPAPTASLMRRLERSRRPKVIVAGLARRIEAFLDDQGQYAGAVSTFSIYHPQDDKDALARLLAYLLDPATSQYLIANEAANALRGRHITVKRQFLRTLPAGGIDPAFPSL